MSESANQCCKFHPEMRFQLQKKFRCIASDRKGVVMVELALTLPLFLALIFISLWISYAINAKYSLDWAVGEGLRLAITRGSTDRVGSQIVNAINYTVPVTIPADRAQRLLFTNMTDAQIADYQYTFNGPEPRFAGSWLSGTVSTSPRGWQSVLDTYAFGIGMTYRMMAGTVPIGNYKDYVPMNYRYVFSYVNETMRVSLGNGNLRYPCDPEAPEPHGGPGCLYCYVLNPETGKIGDGALARVPYYWVGPSTTLNDLPTNRMAIECAFAPEFSMFRLINKLLAPLGGTVNPPVMKARKFYEIEVQMPHP